MSNNTVRFGVVGAGAIGPSHVFAIGKTENAKLGAICSRREEAAKKLADEHGVPYFTSVEDMIEADVVDAVTICTPSGLHLETSLAVAEAGKHLLVEKPLEVTTERIDRIIAAGRKHGVKVGCVFQSRFTPLSRKLKEMIDNGLIGEIYSGSAYSKWYRTQDYYDSASWRGTWKIDGGGCLMNQGIHLIDLFLWFMGNPESVIAIAETKGRKVEVETLALGLINFTNGAKGVVESTTLAYPELPRYLEIFGSRGTVAFNANKLMRMDIMDPTPEEEAWKASVLARQAEEEAIEAQTKKNVVPGTAVPQVDMGHTPIFQDFTDAILTDREPFANGEEARRSVELITAMYKSGQNGSAPVKLR